MELLREIMANGEIRLKSRELYERYGNGRSGYRIVKDSELGRGTVYRLLDGDDTFGVTMDTLLGYLLGLGIPREKIIDMTLGELFDISVESTTE